MFDFGREKPAAKSVFDELAGSYQPPAHLRSADGRRVTAAFLYWLERHVGEGEMAGLKKRFDEQGLSATFNAWVRTGTGFAAPLLETEDVYALLGSENVGKMAKDAGIDSPERAAWLLTQIIPWTVTTFTPRHELPSDVVMRIGLDSFRRSLRNG